MRSITFHFSIASFYLLLGLCWIFFTDLLLTSMALPAEKAFFIHTAKGGVFILATSFLLYYLVKRHSIKLQERETYLSSILDSQTYFLIRVDLQGNYTFVNSAFCQKYGYQEKEIIGQSYAQYLSAEDHEKVKSMMQTCSSYPGKIVSLQTHRYDREGKRLTTSWEFVAVCNATGKVVEVQGVGQDVTAQQTKEIALIRENILESMTDAFFTVDKQWHFTYVNKECERMLNVSREEVLGKNGWEVFPDAVKSKFFTEYQRAMQERVSIKVEEYLPSVKAWFRAAAYPTAEGLAVYFQDITREKELTLEVEKSERYLSALINSIQDLIWVVSPEHEIVTANKAYSRIVEKITKQSVKTGDKAFHFSLEENAQEKWNDYYQRALQGESFRVEEAFFTRREPKFLEISFNPILSAGTVIGAGCIARDVTESKKSMSKIRRQNEKLKEIAHLQSHTLRRPVATILGLISLFDKNTLSSSFNAEVIDKVEKVGQELDAVIHQIVAKTVELE